MVNLCGKPFSRTEVLMFAREANTLSTQPLRHEIDMPTKVNYFYIFMYTIDSVLTFVFIVEFLRFMMQNNNRVVVY